VSTRSDLVDALNRDRSYVSLADITEIELIILKRMRDVTIGDHRSRSHGSGFDFVGLRDWQAGDRFSSIDWAQSTITNFSPLIVREFEQPSTATVLAVADVSRSTKCGANGRPIAAAIARAVATVGLSATFFQDPFGLLTFDEGFAHLTHVRPRTGKSHLVHCLDAYQFGVHVKAGSDQTDEVSQRRDAIDGAIEGFLRGRALVPVISDFLFEDADAVLRDLALVAATHDVFLVLIDSAFAYDLPPVSAGWLEIADVETGRSRLVSRRAYARVAERAREWQTHVQQTAKSLDLDVIVIGLDQAKSDIALGEFVAERRLRKTYS
jgi:uncharacterized protein (DUF58 family)